MKPVKPVRVLHVIDSLARRGGAERQLALEVERLSRECVESHICYLRPPNCLEPVFHSVGAPVYRLDVFGKAQWLSGIMKLRRLVKILGVDLIHTSLYESDMLGGMAGWSTGVPVVSTLVNSVYERSWLIDNPHTNRLKLAFTRVTRALVARRCDSHLIAISQSVKKSAIRQMGVPEDKVCVIYRALSPQWLEDEDTPSLEAKAQRNGVPEGFPVLINIGRLEPQKGQRYIIEAMPLVLRHFPNAVLLVAGEGSLQPQLTALTAELGVQDRVFFLGQRSDVKHLLQASDIFVFPSLYEGLGNALIEAMAMGLPIVGSNIETIAEVTQGDRCGVLVPVRDSKALAESVIKLASHPEDALLLGRQARDIARHHFTLETVLSQRTEAYQSCVAKFGKRWHSGQ